MSNQDLTLRELQTNLPWTIRYSADFRASPMAHKDFAHGLTHIGKAAGKLHAFVDDMDHRKEVADDPENREKYAQYLADLVICALRMANTFPGGLVDLQRAVEDRLETKNGVMLPRPAPSEWRCEKCGAQADERFDCCEVHDLTRKLGDPGHELYKTEDPDAPDVIRDRNGEVTLGLCKRCGRAEIELDEPCAPKLSRAPDSAL